MASGVTSARSRWLRQACQATSLGRGQLPMTLGMRQPICLSTPLCRTNMSSQAGSGPSRSRKRSPHGALKPAPRQQQTLTRAPSPSSRNAQGAATIDAIYQQRRLPLVGAGFAALCLGLYVSLLVSSYMKSPSPSCSCERPSTAGARGEPLPPTGRPPAVDASVSSHQGSGREEARQSAEAFDVGLDVPELLMGITGLRKRIAASARGHVLEVAVGTGRNLAYYDWTAVAAASEVAKGGGGDNGQLGLCPGVLSFTGVDISGDMMSVARTRVRDAVPVLRKLMRRRRAEPMPEAGGTVVDILDSRVRLCITDAEEALPAPPVTGAAHHGAEPPVKYDTIIQTFGLCSVSDPSKLLANMASMVQPGSGRILLLEHGRGRYDWVNGLLDRFADPHYKRYGCWWNRDIEHIVHEAAQTIPGLEVVKLERPLLLQAGTTLLFELRVTPMEQVGV